MGISPFSLFRKLTAKTRGERVKREPLHPPDYWLTVAITILTLFGILMVYDSSVAIAIRDFSDRYYFVREQLRFLAVGAGVLVACSLIDYRRWYALAVPLLLVTLVLLGAVFLPGIGIKALGSHRWIRMGFFVFQPSELAKLALVIYLASWFSFPEKGRMGAFLLLVLMVVGLVAAEPDFGTAVIILAIAVAMYFFSGAPLWQFLALIPLLVAGGVGLAIASPYRLRRIMTFFNPESDPLGASYQIRQILLSLGSGGLLGVGIGKSRQKYEYLPEANTDSIFAVVGEEIGFIGAACVISLFFFIVWRGYRIAKRAPDRFGMLLALGITSWFGIQTLVNLSAIVALIPLTGVPLPLVSYGGSSMIVTLAGAGILLSISRRSMR